MSADLSGQADEHDGVQASIDWLMASIDAHFGVDQPAGWGEAGSCEALAGMTSS
jgi:hypothetical protein